MTGLQIDQSSRSQAEKIYGWACPSQVAATDVLELSPGAVASEYGFDGSRSRSTSASSVRTT
jgi:hypothetical protein